MSYRRTQFGSNNEAAYISLFGGYKEVVVYAFMALVLARAILGFDPQNALSLLLFPLVMAMAVLAGLLFRMAGSVVSFFIIFLVCVYGCWKGVGLFEQLSGSQAIIFLSGFSLLSGALSLSGALLVGYGRRSAELAEQRQHLLYKIFDALPIGIWVRARSGRSIFVNDRWASFSDQSVKEILESRGEVPPVDLGPKWALEVEEMLRAEDTSVRYQSIELEDQRGHKSSMTLLTLRMMIDQENDFGTLSLLVDETALKLYEEKVRQGEQNLNLALKNARMGFWDENIKTGEVRCDDSWYHLIGMDRNTKETAVEMWEGRLHPDDSVRMKNLYEDYYQDGEGSMRVDYRIRCVDDSYIWVQDSVRIVEYDVEGKPQRVMGTMQDISEQKQSELDLKHAKEHAEAANKAKGQFIAIISHEIRTPLNAIIGLSSFLTECELDNEQLDLAQTIHSSGNSLLLLVNDILDFSKIEAGRLELEVQEFPLLLCFEDCVKLFRAKAEEKNVQLSLELSNQLTEFAVGDMERLRQVVQNLLSNALKFTDDGGVELSVRTIKLSDVDEAYRPDSMEPVGYLDQANHEYLEIRVRDTGIGIPLDSQQHIFDAFSQVDTSMTRKYEGTGLGLVICKRLVDAMGGRIWVESEEGVGSSFCFVVRTKLIYENHDVEDLTRTPFDPTDRIASAHPCDILVVGPEDEVAPLMHSCRKLGYAPHSTEDYDLSGKAFRRRHYNLMFIWMGDEAGGMGLARKVSSIDNMLKPDSVLGFAAPEQQVSKEQCRLSGMLSVIQIKPSPQAIREVILNVLGGRG